MSIIALLHAAATGIVRCMYDNTIGNNITSSRDPCDMIVYSFTIILYYNIITISVPTDNLTVSHKI